MIQNTESTVYLLESNNLNLVMLLQKDHLFVSTWNLVLENATSGTCLKLLLVQVLVVSPTGTRTVHFTSTPT